MMLVAEDWAHGADRAHQTAHTKQRTHTLSLSLSRTHTYTHSHTKKKKRNIHTYWQTDTYCMILPACHGNGVKIDRRLSWTEGSDSLWISELRHSGENMWRYTNLFACLLVLCKDASSQSKVRNYAEVACFRLVYSLYFPGSPCIIATYHGTVVKQGSYRLNNGPCSISADPVITVSQPPLMQLSLIS